MPYGLPKFLSKLKSSKKKRLSYQSLRCVLEYLEANKRIHITAHCPDLQNIERTIPFHINSLSLGESQVTLNTVDYVFQKLKKDFNSKRPQIYTYNGVNYVPYRETYDRHGVTTPGDILMKSQNETEPEVLVNRFQLNITQNPLNRINITFKISSKKAYHRFLPEPLELHVAMKKLTTYLFGRRHDIRVRTLVVLEHTRILRLPLGLQFHIEGLWAEFKYIDSLQPIMKEESIPLEILGSYRNIQPVNSSPIIRTAKKLVLDYINLANLLEFTNQKIYVARSLFLERELVEIVKHTLHSGRSIGTCYYFDFAQGGRIPSLSKVLELMKELDIPEITENWIKSTDKHRKFQLQSISFESSASSKLEIFAGKRFDKNRFINCFKIEVVPIVVVEPVQEQVGRRLPKFLSNFFGIFVNKN